MRYLPTIILVLCATALGGLALIHTGGKYYSAIFGLDPVEPGELLYGKDSQIDTKTVTITDSDGDEFVFKLAGNLWVCTSPWEDRADPTYMRQLFLFTQDLKVEEVLPRDGLELKEFGLRDGHTRITMANSKGEITCDYRIGRPAAWQIPIEDEEETLPTVYIRMAQKDLRSSVYLCSTQAGGLIHSLFNKKNIRFRDHKPFHFSPFYLDRLSIQSPEGEVVISRPDLNSEWKITKPLELKTDPAALGKLFADIGRLNALQVENRSSVTLPTASDTSTQGREIRMHFAGAKEDIVLNVYPPTSEDDTTAMATVSDRPDTVFHLPLSQTYAGITSLSQMQTGVNDLRSKTMTHLHGSHLKQIIIRPRGRAATLLRRPAKTRWLVHRAGGFEAANESTVFDLIQALTVDKVAKFVTDAATDLSPYGLDNPLLHVVLTRSNEEITHIAISRIPGNENIYAHIVGQPNIWQLSNETVGKIAIHPWQWRTEHVWHIPKVDVSQIDIERKGEEPIQLKLDYFQDRWTALKNNTDATAKLNPHRANNLLSVLEGLQTTKWLGPIQPTASRALEIPDTLIRIHLNRVADDGTELPPVTKTLSISGNRLYFAKVDTTPAGPDSEGEDSYFLIGPEDIQKLYVNLFQ